jgi:molecular chaperone DnaK
MSEAGDKLPVHEKSRIDQLLSDTRQALNENAPVDQIRMLTSDLTQAANVFNVASEAAAQPHSNEAAQEEAGPDDVIDAEYTEK